ncbi:MAG TPA: serine/threonine-protein kinase [Solirubrobacterales bacterium]|nr:serine/threonine-protein kinase [Solirubrobacterales bacterium]
MNIDLLAGRFEKLRLIDSGGMAEVWLAKDHGPKPFTPDRRVALKILKRDDIEDETALARFEFEGEAMSRFDHPNIAKVFEATQDGDRHFLVMEFVDGNSLHKVLDGRKGPIAPEDAVEIVSQVCTGLEYAHREQIIHRDIKPHNVLLDGGYTEGQRPRIKVTDFGIARVKEATRITRTGGLIGTPPYMAAEISKGAEASFQSDVFACGALLYQLLTNTLPFEGHGVSEIVRKQEEGEPKPPAALNPMVPLALSEATLVALSYRPEARYESAEEMSLAIEAAWEGEDFSQHLPTRHQARSGFPTGPTLYRPAPGVAAPRSDYEGRGPWLPLLKFFATLGGLLVLLAVVLRLTTAVFALPIWVLAVAALSTLATFVLIRSPVFAPDPAVRATARMHLRRGIRTTFRTLVVCALAAYWCLLGYHLLTTVREAIERQPPASQLWLEIGSALLWIAIGLFPLRWLLRSRMQVGRLAVAATVLALAWTASAEVLPEAPGTVAPLFWQNNYSPKQRVASEGKRWTAMLHNPNSRLNNSQTQALTTALRHSRNAVLRALRRAETPHTRHLARKRARRWTRSMRRARHSWQRPRCRRYGGQLTIGASGAAARCS